MATTYWVVLSFRSLSYEERLRKFNLSSLQVQKSSNHVHSDIWVWNIRRCSIAGLWEAEDNFKEWGLMRQITFDSTLFTTSVVWVEPKKTHVRGVLHTLVDRVLYWVASGRDEEYWRRWNKTRRCVEVHSARVWIWNFQLGFLTKNSPRMFHVEKEVSRVF